LASIGYGVAYPFGVLGVILFVKIAPRLFKISIRQEEEKYNQELLSEYAPLKSKNFVVENKNVFGKTLEELKIRTMTHTNISRVLHNGEAFTPTAQTILHENDIIKAVGTEDDLKKVELLIGHPTDQKIPLSKKYVIKDILVTNKEVVNKHLSELGLLERFNATATSIRRAGIDIIPDATTKLKFGDKVTIACTEQQLPLVRKLLGDDGKVMTDLDFLPVSLGILAGILLGKVSLPLFGFNLSLGLTGGVLLAAIILSRIGKTGWILWNVSGSSNQLLRKIGLIFFLVTVGTDAGSHLLEVVKNGGVTLFLAGAFITLFSMLAAMIVGHFVLKMNFLTLLGALTGSMTSTPALSAIEPMTESNAPKVAYAAVYPVALVLIIIFSQLLALF
jgi:putative transport protein